MGQSKPNILVCGKTGAGKTSLVKALTHPGTVPNDAISDGRPCTAGFALYQTEIANFIDAEGLAPGEKTVAEYLSFLHGEMHKRLESEEAANMVHCIWYCIDGSGARVTPGDAKLIRELGAHAFVVITKEDLLRKSQIEPMFNVLDEFLPRGRMLLVSSEKGGGLEQLLEKTEKIANVGLASAKQAVADRLRRWDEYYQKHAGDVSDAAVGRKTILDASVGLLGGGSLTSMLASCFVPYVVESPIAASLIGKATKAISGTDMKVDAKVLKKEFTATEREAQSKKWKT